MVVPVIQVVVVTEIHHHSVVTALRVVVLEQTVVSNMLEALVEMDQVVT